MKIGLVFDDSLDRTDGVQQYVKTLGSFYSRQGHDVSYLVGETKLVAWDGGTVYSMSRNLAVNFNRNRLSTPLPASRQHVNAVLAAHDFDILHVQVPYSPFMAGRVIKAAGPRTAVAGTFHIIGADRLSNAANRLLGLWTGRQLKHFDALWSVSTGAQVFLQEYYGLQSKVMPNIIDAARYAHAVPLLTARHEQKIVFLGRFVERKGVRQLIEMMALLVHKHHMDHAKLYMGGDGPLRPYIENLVKEKRLGRHVEFLGFIDEKDKPGLLASAEIAVFPSLYGESFGIVLLEAMAAGAGVVIGGNNPGYSSVLGEWQEALVQPKDSEQFANQIKWLLEDEDVRRTLHRRQQHAVKQYDIQTVGPQLLNAYATMIANKQATEQ